MLGMPFKLSGRSVMWVLEAILMLPGLLLMETAHAYECASTVSLWGKELVSDVELFVDVWSLLVITVIIVFYLHNQFSDTGQTDYLVCRLVSAFVVVVSRAFIAYDASVACVYAPIFVHTITLIPLRCMEHFSDKC